MVRSTHVIREDMLEWFAFVLNTYTTLNIETGDQVWNGDETAIASQDNVPYVDAAVATSVRIFGLFMLARHILKLIFNFNVHQN